MPQRVEEGKYEGYLEFKYPREEIFNKVQIKVEKGGMYDFDARIRFDYPYLLPELGLFEIITSNDLEDIAIQLPVEPDNNNPYSTTLQRKISLRNFESTSSSYLLTLSDDATIPVLEHLNK